MQDLLTAGLESLGLDPAQQPCNQYLKYIELLHKWNQAYNLTALKQPEQMLSRHVLDSLSVLSLIEGKCCMDIGTGAGLPGLILAMALPDTEWTLLDSNQKKIRFLQHVKAELHINNVEVVHSRVEDFIPDSESNTIICRAFAPINRMLKFAQHLITKDNQLLAMKGKTIEAELEESETQEFIIKINDIAIDNEDSSAKLVQIRRAG
jgi:16S rRNA (guanine527-N7)-methyltransferase